MTANDIEEMKTALRAVLTEEIETRLEKIAELLDKHEKCLYGNGKEGIIETVHRNERFISNLSQVLQAVVIALMIAAVTGIIYLLVTHGQMGNPVG